MKIAGRYARQFSRQSFTPLRYVQAGIAGYPNVPGGCAARNRGADFVSTAIRLLANLFALVRKFTQWTSHGYSTSRKVRTASTIRSRPISSLLSALRCAWSQGHECLTLVAARGRCCAPGHAITALSAPAST